MSLTIRPWAEHDATQLRPMIADLLLVNYGYGAEMQPTERNVDILYRLGLHWALTGEPTLVACDGETIVGFTLWGNLGNPVKLDVRGKPLTGIGTYVLPSHRRRGVSVALRQAGFALARAAGYTHMTGAAYHDAALKSALAVGWKPIATIAEVTL